MRTRKSLSWLSDLEPGPEVEQQSDEHLVDGRSPSLEKKLER
jgi:hypothetical protein